ncbi:MAG: CRISPR-associated protein, Csm4 family [Methylohalobius crimeensis]
MKRLRIIIEPRTAFGGPMRGDTLFGQICWAVRHRWGEGRLAELLTGYTEDRPFLVVSDAFPHHFIPRPSLPMHCYNQVPGADRKRVKKRVWLPLDQFQAPLSDWLAHCRTEKEVARAQADRQALDSAHGLWESRAQPHNTLNRLTGTTGTGEFAPYGMPQLWSAPGLKLDLYCCFNPDRIDRETIIQLLKDIGAAGYGRDVSIGLGKFEVIDKIDGPWPSQERANAWLTLSPCAPQGEEFAPEASFYQPFVRFGRHGDVAVHLTGRPFKNPVLMADSGALLTPKNWHSTVFVGQGLGGNGQLSKTIPTTVQQGYAPALPVFLEVQA